MLLVYADEQVWSDSERAQCYKDSTQLAHKLKNEGRYLATNPLQSVAKATSVQVRSGMRLVTDGPFAETREQLGGYYIIDVKDLDEAIAVAERIPGVHKGTIEIRPVLEIPDLPEN